MIRIFKHLSTRDWAYIATSILFIVAAVYCDLEIPGYMSEITTLVKTEGSDIGEVWFAGVMMLLYALGSLIASCIVAFFAARVGASLAQHLRSLLFDKTLDFSLEEVNRFSTASLITRSTNDITQVQTLITMGMQATIKAPILAVWAVTKIMGKSWEWSVITGGAVVLLMIVVVGMLVFVVPRFRQIQKQTDAVNQAARENLTGLQVVHAYNAKAYEEEKFEASNTALTNTNLFVNRITALMQPSMSFVMSALTLAIYGVGALLINNSSLADRLTIFSDMVVFSSYAAQIIMAFMMMVMIFMILPRASVSAGRINEVLDTQPRIVDGNAKEGTPEISGKVEFKNVSFAYPDAAGNTLEDISFTAQAGETIAFIGATGSGKSTLINLIPRFYDVSEGEVLVDGIDVRDYTQSALRNRIGFVSQRATLFSGTIRSNVAYGDNDKPPVSNEKVISAIEVAQAREFVEEKERSYNAHVTRGGANLSGGQKQRLSIARALCRDPVILIFDDSFSALDYKTDKQLREKLHTEVPHATKIIIAQRIGTIKDADKIIVLDEGRIVGEGKHAQLMKSCDVYQEIGLSQLSEEELHHV